MSTLVSVLRDRVEQVGEKPILFLWGRSDHKEQYTYADLVRGAFGYAAFLREQGVKPGDRVLLVMLTRVEFFFAFFGCLLARALPVPVHPPMFILEWDDYREKFLHIVSTSRPSLILCYRDIREAVEKKCLGQHEPIPIVNVEEVRWPAGAESDWRWPEVSERDVAYLQYTSGSTGLPKGARLTHGALTRNIKAIGDRLPLTDRDIVVSWLPLYHDMGLIGNFLTPLYWQCQVCLMPTEYFVMQPTTFFKVIHQFKATLINSPNFGYAICNKYTKRRGMEGVDLSSLRFSLIGADHLVREDLAEYNERFTPYRLDPQIMAPVYGMSECCLAVSFSPVGAPLPIEHVDRDLLSRTGEAVRCPAESQRAIAVFSVGQPLDGIEVAIRDARGRPCADGVLGSIWVRTEMLMEGYAGDPARTAEVLRDGWFDSGDLGYLRGDTLYYFERAADCIRHHGTLFRPRDFEVPCADIPDIKRGRSAAFGMRVPSEDGHQDIHLLIETGTLYRDKYLEISGALNELYRTRLGTAPDFIYVVGRGSIPQTSSGKLQRTKCRNRIVNKTFDVHFHLDNRSQEVLFCK